MEKPIVFLSHSSKDEKPLKVLKSLLQRKTGGALSLFLSGDGQSIPLGRNWVHEIQQALDNSRLMFVFVSPGSLKSSWIHFEAGYAYSKGIRVVPVGILGVDLGQLAPPLSLLQGFNVTSEAGLNNLVAMVNQEFDHSHEESFTRHDYEAVFSNAARDGRSLFTSRLANLIDSIELGLGRLTDPPLDLMEQYLRDKSVEYNRQANKLTTYGLSAWDMNSPGVQNTLALSISMALAGATLPLVGDFLVTLPDGLDRELELFVELNPAVKLLDGHHNITARLLGTSISLGAGDALQYGHVTFTLDRHEYHGSLISDDAGNAYVRIKCKADQLESLDVEGLLATLFEREVLSLEGTHVA